MSYEYLNVNEPKLLTNVICNYWLGNCCKPVSRWDFVKLILSFISGSAWNIKTTFLVDFVL